MRPLEQTQREFFSALLMPLRGRSRESTELAPVHEGHSAEFLATAEALLKQGANLTPAESLELYHRQYWFRILDSIEEDFPILKRIAGHDAFWRMIEAYLSACPSGSFTLRHLGSRFADFIDSWNEFDDGQRRWFSSIARLEYAYMACYEAAEWPVVLPEELSTATLALQPHVVLLELPVPADLCVDGAEFPPSEEGVVHLAVWRGSRGSSVRCRLQPVESTLLQRLRRGGTLESIFAEPNDPEPTPEEVSQWFADWQGRGWIASPPTEESEDYPVVSHHSTADIEWDRIDKMGSQARAMED